MFLRVLKIISKVSRTLSLKFWSIYFKKRVQLFMIYDFTLSLNKLFISLHFYCYKLFLHLANLCLTFTGNLILVRFFSSPMSWNEMKDVQLCREVLVVEPYKHKKGSRERGQLWTTISDNLNNIPGFTVTARAVRERLQTLEVKFKRNNNIEIKATGINPEQTELDTLLEEIVARSTEYENSFDEKTQLEQTKDQNEKQLGEHVRMQALETYKETQKRQSEDGEPSSSKPKRQRNTGSDTVAFLKEKMERDIGTREKELTIREKELALQQQQRETVLEQQSNMMLLMTNSIQQTQQMTNTYIQAQQAQSQALFNILDRLTKK